MSRLLPRKIAYHQNALLERRYLVEVALEQHAIVLDRTAQRAGGFAAGGGLGLGGLQRRVASGVEVHCTEKSPTTHVLTLSLEEVKLLHL